MSDQENDPSGQYDPPPSRPSGMRIDPTAMSGVAARLDRVADLLSQCAGLPLESLGLPGTDPVSAQTSRVLQQYEAAQRRAFGRAADEFASHAGTVRAQVARAIATETDVDDTFRGELE